MKWGEGGGDGLVGLRGAIPKTLALKGWPAKKIFSVRGVTPTIQNVVMTSLMMVQTSLPKCPKIVFL